MPTFEVFLSGFFAIFTHHQFRGSDFLTYLQRPAPRRAGDEASIVDNTVISPLLDLLGFAPGEQVYNQNNKNGRPDFVPTTDEYGDCFVVEDKSTALDLTLDIADPESNLSQLFGYMRSLGLSSGWLTNGRRLMVWQLSNPLQLECKIDLDIPLALRERASGGENGLSPATKQALLTLWERFRKETFADWELLEKEIATELDEWQLQALPVGGNEANQELLVDAVKSLLQDLQVDARKKLDVHLQRHAEYTATRDRLHAGDRETIPQRLDILRERVLSELKRFAPLVGLEPDEVSTITDSLYTLEHDPRIFLNTKELLSTTLKTINAASMRKFADDRKGVKAWSKFDNGLGALGGALQEFGDVAFTWHQKAALYQYDYRESIQVYENYTIWKAVVQETMLGGLEEAQRRDEFALQATYVIFIRLLLIRVCEDKGILPNPILSDGGLKRWQDVIERYFIFTTGNPYNTLLDIAYQNAQNIYAHFFTGRELFNWYSLDRLRFIRVLYQLNRFNFTNVDSDLIGTIYNTYVGRPEKK